jgi:hypothetical protein
MDPYTGTNWNKLEQIGTNWNKLEQIGTNWNKLEQIGTKRNKEEQREKVSNHRFSSNIKYTKPIPVVNVWVEWPHII